MARCSKCGLNLGDGQRGYCRSCFAAYMRNWRKSLSERLKELRAMEKELTTQNPGIGAATGSYVISYPKPPNWCKDNGIAHSYKDGPTLTVDPPISTRICRNCGHTQTLQPSSWKDV